MSRKALAAPLILALVAACASAVNFVESKVAQAVGTWYCSGDRVLEAAVHPEGHAVIRSPEYGYGVKFTYTVKDGLLNIAYESPGATAKVESLLSLEKLEKDGIVSDLKKEKDEPSVVSLGESGSFSVDFVSPTEVHFKSSDKNSTIAKCYKDSLTPDFKESSVSLTAALTVNSHILSRSVRDKASVFDTIKKVGKEDPAFMADFEIKVGGSSGALAWPGKTASAPETERLVQITDKLSGLSVCIELGSEAAIKSSRRMGGWSLVRESTDNPACAGAIVSGLSAGNDW